MKSLWADVVENGYSNIDAVSGLEATEEAAIEARITDDPVDVTSYVGECLMGTVAVEAALATVEGRCAVDYIRATTESAKAEVAATMESAIADAWETLKRYVKKAWKAIKEFLQKVWNKIKAKAATIKAMITKYEKVLRDAKVGNLQVSWAQFDFNKLMSTRDRLLKDLDDSFDTIKDSKDKQNIVKANNLDEMIRNIDTNKDLKIALWGNENGPDYTNVAWSGVKAEAIAVADGKVEKIVEDYMNLGEKNEREMLNALKDEENKAADKADDAKSDGSRNKASNAGKWIRAKLKVSNQAATLLTSGANAYRNQCVAACRKAISAAHGVKESYEPSQESTSSFDSIMATML